MLAQANYSNFGGTIKFDLFYCLIYYIASNPIHGQEPDQEKSSENVQLRFVLMFIMNTSPI